MRRALPALVFLTLLGAIAASFLEPDDSPGPPARASTLPGFVQGLGARCVERWSTTVLGLRAGYSEENFEWAADGSISARSVFTPTSTARALGAPGLEREARASAREGLIWRHESREKRGSRSDSQWKRLDSWRFERSDSAGSEGRASAEAFEGLNLDTTILPRVAMLGWIAPGQTRSARIFTAGSSPAMAEIALTASGRELAVRSSDLMAFVELAAGGRPISMEVRSGKAWARSELVSGGCGS